MILILVFSTFIAIFGILRHNANLPIQEVHSHEIINSCANYIRVFGYLPKEDLFEAIGISADFFATNYSNEINPAFQDETLISIDSKIWKERTNKEEKHFQHIQEENCITLKGKKIEIIITKELLARYIDKTDNKIALKMVS